MPCKTRTRSYVWIFLILISDWRNGLANSKNLWIIWWHHKCGRGVRTAFKPCKDLSVDFILCCPLKNPSTESRGLMLTTWDILCETYCRPKRARPFAKNLKFSMKIFFLPCSPDHAGQKSK